MYIAVLYFSDIRVVKWIEMIIREIQITNKHVIEANLHPPHSPQKIYNWVFSDQKNTKIIKKLKSAQVSM